MELKEEKLLKGSEIMDKGLDGAAGIEENVTTPSCPERWTGREGKSAHERGGKGKVSRRKSDFC